MSDREGRGRANVRDPAQAIAMAKCWLATWTKRVEAGGTSVMPLPPTNSFHPAACGYCELPRDLVIQMLEEFQSWANISTYEKDVPLRLEIEAWETLPATEQQLKVRRAQGYLEPDRGRTADDRRSPW